MRVDLDAKVVARDGEEIGSVDRAIVDPNTNEVTAIVISTGAVFGRDIVVAREELEQASEDGDSIRLRLTKDELEQLPDFTPEAFSPVPPTWVAPAGYGFPSSGYVWPVAVDPTDPMAAPIPVPEAIAADEMGLDEETDLVTVNKGAVVMDRHGDDVGVVDDVRFDARTGELQGFVLRVGGTLRTLFGGGDTLELSRREIDRVGESIVYLRLAKDEIEAAAHAHART
jgi:sporulation protein YlmC with PRC-barrel domain